MTYIFDLINSEGLGEDVTVQAISGSVNDWGHQDVTIISYTFTVVPQVMSGDEEFIAEGVLHTGDLVVFFNPSDSNISKVVIRNRIVYRSITYEITDVIAEPTTIDSGHIEVHARRV